MSWYIFNVPSLGAQPKIIVCPESGLELPLLVVVAAVDLIFKFDQADTLPGRLPCISVAN